MVYQKLKIDDRAYETSVSAHLKPKLHVKIFNRVEAIVKGVPVAALLWYLKFENRENIRLATCILR